VPRGLRAHRLSAPVAPPIIAATVAELTNLQAEYAAWLQSLPDNLQDTATAEALRAISELDLSELQTIVPPRGFGRD
jgi:hypothetical protein